MAWSSEPATAGDAAPLLARFARWGVVPEGPARRTPSAVLARGRRGGLAVVGKLALVEEERRGGRLLAAWSGRGAVPVLESDGDALLMVRAAGPRDLAAIAAGERDDEATRALVDVVTTLHRTPAPGADLLPLDRWFGALLRAEQRDALLDVAAAVAREVLAATSAADRVALHGDVHHGNVLDLGGSWAAIDPKALAGHRAFDVANLLLNPAAGLAVDRLDRRIDLVEAGTGLDRRTIERWTLAWCGLSLAWRQGGEADDHARAARAVGALLAGRVSRS